MGCSFPNDKETKELEISDGREESKMGLSLGFQKILAITGSCLSLARFCLLMNNSKGTIQK